MMENREVNTEPAVVSREVANTSVWPLAMVMQWSLVHALSA